MLPYVTRNLDDALATVASRSFYEDTRITPLSDATGDVLAWYVEDGSYILDTDEVTWTYEKGICDGPETEKSRLMETYEFFSTAEHVRYHLPNSVEHLEDGTSSVVFAYAIVDLDPDDPDFDTDPDLADNTVGWALMALALDAD